MKSVSFVNMKGGVAKTTLAVNIATTLVRRFEKKVLLIDLDPQFNATQCLVGPEEYVKLRTKGLHTIFHIFEDAPPSQISMVSGATKQKPIDLKDIDLIEIEPGLDMVLGDLELYRLEMGAGQGREHRLKRFLAAKKADKNYDYVIIDTPPTPSAWMMSGLLACDYYLIPVKPEPLSWTGIDLLKGVIGRCSDNFAHPMECAGVVLTIAEENTVAYKSSVAFLDGSDVWKGKRFKSALPKRTAIAREQANQNLILDMGDSLAKSAIVNITDEFIKRVV